MKKYTPEELAEVLRLHKLWLDGDPDGVRADFCSVKCDDEGFQAPRAALLTFARTSCHAKEKTYTCSCCGGRARKLNALTGYCPTCHYRHLADEERETRAQIVRIANEKDRATQAAKREYDRLRKENHRKSQQTGISRKHAKKAWDRRTRNVTK